LGAHAEVAGDRLKLYAVVADTDGSTLISASVAGPVGQAAELGAEAARKLLDQGARAILARVYGEAPPLAGVRILVTRTPAQAGALTTRLRSMGAEVVELPVIAVEELDFAPPQGAYDWLLFTSANAVSCFFGRAALPEGARVAAIGPATESELRDRGVGVALTARTSTGEGLAAAFEGIDLQGKRLLIPRAETAREALESGLRARGAVVEILPVYRNVVPPGLEEAARALLTGPSRPHWVTLMSPSAVKNLLAAVGADLLKGVRIATIGPITTEAARRHGLNVDAEAAEATSDALGRAMAELR
jgi:uroporphyrinogen III methyltransferase/synthase